MNNLELPNIDDVYNARAWQKFTGYEVRGVRTIVALDGSVKVVPNRDCEQFWGVYGLLPGGGSMPIGHHAEHNEACILYSWIVGEDPEFPKEKCGKFDAYEIHGIASEGEQTDDPAEIEYWSLFGHIAGAGLECVGDFEAPGMAREIYTRITGNYHENIYKTNKG